MHTQVIQEEQKQPAPIVIQPQTTHMSIVQLSELLCVILCD